MTYLVERPLLRLPQPRLLSADTRGTHRDVRHVERGDSLVEVVVAVAIVAMAAGTLGAATIAAVHRFGPDPTPKCARSSGDPRDANRRRHHEIPRRETASDDGRDRSPITERLAAAGAPVALDHNQGRKRTR